jgi:hypothetical protein
LHCIVRDIIAPPMWSIRTLEMDLSRERGFSHITWRPFLMLATV